MREILLLHAKSSCPQLVGSDWPKQTPVVTVEVTLVVTVDVAVVAVRVTVLVAVDDCVLVKESDWVDVAVEVEGSTQSALLKKRSNMPFISMYPSCSSAEPAVGSLKRRHIFALDALP
jgi:hypothetical protein